jgi:hypothetical protein
MRNLGIEINKKFAEKKYFDKEIKKYLKFYNKILLHDKNTGACQK